VLIAIDTAELLVIAPSNPLVSTGPILALPGIREAFVAAGDRGIRRVAVSPIVGGRALKGPADRMLASTGHEASAIGVARLYEGLVDTFVLDETDAGLAPQVAALGMTPLVLPSVMASDEDRAALARAIGSA